MNRFNLSLWLVVLMSILSSCMHIQKEDVEYRSQGVLLKGYLAYDETLQGKRPGILVVHEWWGHNEYARRRADMLAELGYTALAVDMYGEGKQAAHPDEAGKFATAIMENMNIAEARFKAALDILREHRTVDHERIAAIGYCFGGSIVLQMARNGMDLDGVVSFHGGLSTSSPAEQGKVKSRILVLHGGDDQLISPEQIARFRDEMIQPGIDFKFISYEGAQHSFTNPAADTYAKKFNIPVGYDPEGDRKSWEEMKNFLKEILGTQE